MPTRRQERVNNRLVQEVSDALRRLKDPRIGFVTVTGAEVSPDLREARIRVSVLGSEDEQQSTMRALQHATGYIQSIVAGKLELKVTPRLTITADRSSEYADNIARLIAEARATDPDSGIISGQPTADQQP